jgi:hypothetical protein
VGQGGALDEEGAVRDGVHALELLDVHVEAALEEVAVVPQQEAAQRGGGGSRGEVKEIHVSKKSPCYI